jgi:uncharacterized damage-inducible protein DinB
MAANKLAGIRAALCHDVYSAHQSVEHDNANVICLGARIVGDWLALELLQVFLETTFSDEEPYRRRIEKLEALHGRSVSVASQRPDAVLLERLLAHDAWTTRAVLERCRALTAAQGWAPADVGHGSIWATLRHAIGNVEIWTTLMEGGTPERIDEADPETESVDRLLARHEAASARFAALARRITAEGRLDDSWIDTLDDPPQAKSYGGTILHVLTHNHQHRAEVLHMLQRLGLADLPEGDLLGWEAATAGDARDSAAP